MEGKLGKSLDQDSKDRARGYSLPSNCCGFDRVVRQTLARISVAALAFVCPHSTFSAMTTTGTKVVTGGAEIRQTSTNAPVKERDQVRDVVVRDCRVDELSQGKGRDGGP